MARPTLLCSLLSSECGQALVLGQELHRAGLDVRVHRWENSIGGVAALIAALAQPECVLWCMVGTARDFADGRICRLLSLAALGVQARRGGDFPLMVWLVQGKVERLPEALAGASMVSRKAAAGSILARLHMAKKVSPVTWRVDVHCPNAVDIWLEVGPAAGLWQGCLCGVWGVDSLGGKVRILAHAVGAPGKVPEQSLLECPLQGLNLPTERGNFEAWGAGNVLGPDLAYYVQVSAAPQMLLFGPLPRHGSMELTALDLEQGGQDLEEQEVLPVQKGKAYIHKKLAVKHKKRGSIAGGSQRS